MIEEAPTMMESTNDSYKKLIAGRTAANERKTEEAEKAREESGVKSVEAPLVDEGTPEPDVEYFVDVDVDIEGPAPDMSWTKDKIVEYFVDVDVDVERDELEKMTKAQLIERFTDNLG